MPFFLPTRSFVFSNLVSFFRVFFSLGGHRLSESSFSVSPFSLNVILGEVFFFVILSPCVGFFPSMEFLLF